MSPVSETFPSYVDSYFISDFPLLRQVSVSMNGGLQWSSPCAETFVYYRYSRSIMVHNMSTTLWIESQSYITEKRLGLSISPFKGCERCASADWVKDYLGLVVLKEGTDAQHANSLKGLDVHKRCVTFT